MTPDVIFLVLMALAIFRGYRKGFIIAVFSLLGLVIGLAAAIKLSVVTAAWLQDRVPPGAKWLPLISFAIVFTAIALLVRLIASLIEKALELAMLGWANKLAGIIVYLFLYAVIWSVILFYAEKINLPGPDTIAHSQTYTMIKPLGPATINAAATFMPIFKNMFNELENFFAAIAEHSHHR